MNSDFIQGIGGGEDLQRVGYTAIDNYPIIHDGYFYGYNKEFYLFASGCVVGPLTSGIIPNLNYISQTPYFVISNSGVIGRFDTVSDPSVFYLDTSYNIYTGSDIGWEPNQSGTFDLYITNSGYDGNYIVYESAQNFIFTQRALETSNLALNIEPTDEVYTLKVKPLYIGNVYDGQTVPFAARAYNIKGMPLEYKTVSWYKNYILFSGVIPEEDGDWIYNSGIHQYYKNKSVLYCNTSTDVTGVTVAELLFNSYEQNPYIYAFCSPIASSNFPIIIGSGIIPSGVFQYDLNNFGIFYSTQEAMTAIGLDPWCNLWNDISYDTQYVLPSGIIAPPYPTRGIWKANNEQYERPPFGTITSVDEASGAWNGIDFASVYPTIIGSSGIVDFMDTMYVADRGYWGQVILTGAQMQNVTLSGLCLNTSSDYIISPQITYSGIIPDLNVELGVSGNWDTIYGSSSYNSYYYVLYVPGDEILLSGMPTSYTDIILYNMNFYFRGLAVGETQIFMIGQLIDNLPLRNEVLGPATLPIFK